jgi:peptidyl-prolyl cis-trans isomerase D
MITWFRGLAQTWAAKILFVLLILSFAVWGIEDVVRNLFRDTTVARVGDQRVEVTEAQNAIQRETQRIMRQMGPRFEMDENLRRLVANQAVEALVADRAQRIEAARLGLSTSAEAVREHTFAIPAFQVAGRFSRAALDQWLRQNGMTEEQFLALIAADLLRIQLVGAVRSGAIGPDALSRAIYAQEQERRVADVVELPLLSAPEPEAPTEAQLRRFHENNPERFSSPEFREVSLMLLNAAAIMPEIRVNEAEIAQAYEQNRGRFASPERRALLLALLPEESDARTIAERWAAGAAQAEIEAAVRVAGGTFGDLGEGDREALPLPDLAEAAFAAAEGAVTAPVRSPFGWHVFRVERVIPAASRSLAEVRDELREEIASERAADLVFERVNRIEDALAGGVPTAEVAARYNLPLTRLALDAQGRDAEGRPAALPVPAEGRSDLLRTIFRAEAGVPTRLEELPTGGFLAVELNGVTPPALRPFEAVEAAVRRDWLTDQRRRAQDAAAAQLLAAVQSGRPIAEAAAERGLRADRLGPFSRRPEPNAPPGARIPPELLMPLFAARVGEATMVPTAAGFAVAQLAGVVPANPGADPLGLARVRSAVESGMQEDLEQQFQAAIRGRAGVTLNDALMRQIGAR